MKGVISIVHMPEGIACCLTPMDDIAMISITEPGYKANLKNDWKHLLRLQFHDIDVPIKGYKQFDDSDAKKIEEFVNGLPSDVEEIFVHCHAGISRSAAISFFLHTHLDVEIKNEGLFLLKNKHIVNVLKNHFERVHDEKFYDELFGVKDEASN